MTQKIEVPIPNPLIMDLAGKQFFILLELCDKFPALKVETLCLLAKQCSNSIKDILDKQVGLGEGFGRHDDLYWDFSDWGKVLSTFDFQDIENMVRREFDTSRV